MGDEIREWVAVLLGVDQGARVQASLKLMALGEEARAPVVKVLTDVENSYLARVWATIILAHIPDDPEGSVCCALRAALQSPAPGLRWAALGALGSQRAVAAIPDIAAHLNDHADIPDAWSEEDSQPAYAAEAALRAIGTPEALAILADRDVAKGRG